MNNRERAIAARKALDVFSADMGLEEDDVETAVVDLLADLMHLCHINKLEFDLLLARGRQHFDFERDEEDQPI